MIFFEGDEEVSDLIIVAREEYPPGERNKYRHLNSRDFTDSGDAVIPDDEAPDAFAGGGGAMMPAAGGDMPPRGVYNPDPEASVLQALAESMMPWNHVPAAPPGEEDDEENAAIDALFDE